MESNRGTASPTSNSGTALQRYNLTRAAISLNSMRFDNRNDQSNLYGRHSNTTSGVNVSDRCSRLHAKINDISVSLAKHYLHET